jgi:hypothetical protein
LQGLFSIPADVLPPILQMLIGDRFKFIVMHGDPMRYRHASVLRYCFETHLEEDDLPAES